jgi:LysR family transcriptional regulator, low CO2-responsive transcriptional regulator
MQLTQLRSFVAVARLGSLTRAAEELGYTEPAVHLQLAALAKTVGSKLFVRSHRRMELTALGGALLPHAQAALDAVDTIAAEASHHRAVTQRVVRLGVGRSTGSYLFPHLAAAVREKDPGIVLEPSLMSVGELYAGVAKGELDIAFASGLREQAPRHGPGAREVTTVPFRRYHWFLVSSPRVAKQIDAGGGDFGIFLPEYAHETIPRIQSSLPPGNSYHFTLAQDTEATKATALADLGIACVPAYTVGFEIGAGSLVLCFPELPPADSIIYIGHEKHPRHPDVARVVAATRRLPNFSVDGLHPHPAPFE